MPAARHTAFPSPSETGSHSYRKVHMGSSRVTRSPIGSPVLSSLGVGPLPFRPFAAATSGRLLQICSYSVNSDVDEANVDPEVFVCQFHAIIYCSNSETATQQTRDPPACASCSRTGIGGEILNQPVRRRSWAIQ